MQVRHGIRYLLGLAGLFGVGDSLVFLAYLRIDTGTMLPGIIGLFLLWHVWMPSFFGRWLTNRGFRCFWICLWCAGLILAAGLPVFVIHASIHQTRPETVSPDAIIVLGAGLTRSGQPGVLLAARLQTAIAVAQRFPQIPIIVSGGQGLLEPTSEALSMRNYLLEHGHIVPSRIWMEDRSRNTHENLVFSRHMLLAHHLDIASHQIAIITSNFHTFRSRLLAQHSGYGDTAMIAAPIPWTISPNAWLREYLACFKAWGLEQM